MSTPTVLAVVCVVVALLVVAAGARSISVALGRVYVPREELAVLAAELRANAHELRVARGEAEPPARMRAALRDVPAVADPRTERIPAQGLATAVENADAEQVTR